MKHTKILTVALLATGLLLAGCNNASKDEPKVDPTPSGETETSILPFIGNSKVRFDIMSDLGLTFKLGETTIVSTEQLTLVNAAVTYTGEAKVSTVNFIVVTERVDNGINANSCAYNPGVEIAHLSEYLEGFATDYLSGSNVNKAYVAISDGAAEGTWTKGLNDELDAKIQKQIDFLKESN